jgi:hypothetical protein
LLILAGKVVLANRATDVLQTASGSRRMQGLAQTASEALRSPDRLDRVHLVGFGDRRKAEDLPRLLTESVADEVVLVQPRCVMMTIAPRHLSLSVRRSGTESS